MNKRWTFIIVILSLTASSFGCGISIDLGPGKPATATAVPVAENTATSLPPTITETNIPPTETTAPPTATATLIPTETPGVEQAPIATEPLVVEPLPTALPTLIPPPMVISRQNAAGLTLKRLNNFGLGSLQKLRISPDGQFLLLSYSNMLALLKTSDLSVIWEVDPQRYLVDVTFTENGSHLVSYSPGGTVVVWDASTGNVLARTIQQREGVRSMALSENGKYFAVVDYSDVTRVYETESGKEVMKNNGQSNPGGINGIQLSPGGGTLLIDGFDSKPRKQVQQWSVTDGTYKIGLLGLITELSEWKFSPDAKRVFGINTRSLTSLPSNTLTVWNASNGALIKAYDNFGVIKGYMISPDGSIIALTTVDNQIHLLDVETGQKRGAYSGHSTTIEGMEFTPDSQGIISISADGIINEWDVVNQKKTKESRYVFSGSRSPVSFSLGSMLAVFVSGEMKKVVIAELMEKNSFKILNEEPNQLHALAISPDASLSAAVDSENRIIIWGNKNSNKVQMIDAKTRTPIKKLLFSRDNHTIASINTGQVFLWDVATGKKLKEFVGNNDFAWSPDGKVIASDSTDNRLYLNNVETGKQLAALDAEAITSIKYSPDGQYIAAGGTRVQPKERGLINLVFQFDTGSRLRLPVEMPDLPGNPTSLAYSPNMDLLAGCDSQGNIYIWNLLDGSRVAYFEEIAAHPGTVEFNLDGTELFIGGGDGSIGVISTTGSGSATPPDEQLASSEGSDELPVLSPQAYTHTSRVVSLNLPVGWTLSEDSESSFMDSDPKGRGFILFLATNTLTPLSDESFLNYIDAQEKYLSGNAGTYQEIDRGVDTAKGFAYIIRKISINGVEYQFETEYTRIGPVIYQFNFFTQAPYIELFAPLFQGVYVSHKVDTNVVATFVPYDNLNKKDSPDGKFMYYFPTGWMEESLSSSDPASLQCTAPDNSAFMQLYSAPWNINDLTGETEIFAAIQTALEEREESVIIVDRIKMDDGWLITYSNPGKEMNGKVLGKRIDNTLQMVNIEYQIVSTNLYTPLADKLLSLFKLK